MLRRSDCGTGSALTTIRRVLDVAAVFNLYQHWNGSALDPLLPLVYRSIACQNGILALLQAFLNNETNLLPAFKRRKSALGQECRSPWRVTGVRFSINAVVIFEVWSRVRAGRRIVWL